MEKGDQKTKDAERAARLAEQLRQNLRRRKAQARDVETPGNSSK